MKRTNVSHGGGAIYNKKYIISLLIALFGIVSLLGGTSYAVLKGTNSDSNEQIIKTGSVELKLTENFDDINKKVTIMSDEEGLLQEETYDFNIKNIGDSPAKYDLKLINEVPSSYTGKVLDTKYIKVGLEINGEEYGPMSLEKVKNILDSDVIYKDEILNYKLRIWLDKSEEEEISKLEDYKAFLKLRVDANQRPNSMETKNTAKSFSFTGDVQEYTVPRNGYYYIEMAGAEGGSAKYSTSYSGGKGGYTSGYVELKAKDKLYFYVGGMGSSHSGTSSDTVTNNGKGYNGGSTGNFYASNSNAGGGGGATDVRLVKASTQKYRYVRSYISGSSANTGNHWVELEVFDKNHSILSKGKSITHNGTSLTYGGTATSISALTDGDITSANYVEVKGVNDAYIEMDLGADYDIGEVFVWHYYTDGRTYKKNKVVLIDSTRSVQDTVFDSDVDGEYAEVDSGKQISTFDMKSLISRIMVAGGGGGADSHTSAPNYSGYGGDGGALYGEKAQNINSSCYKYGNSGTQNSGGQSVACSSSYKTIVSGYFGRGGTVSHSGGGGGYYGGGSGQHTSAGGGSSYISGYAGVNSVKDSTTITHTNNTLHYSGKYFIGGKMIAGANSGNGYAKISYVDVKPKKRTTKLNDVRYIKDCITANTDNKWNAWAEIQAIKDGINLAKGKTITGITAHSTEGGPISNVTDGNILSYVNSSSGASGSNECVVLDLGQTYDLDEVALWNYFGNQRRYISNHFYVSSDNSNWTDLSSNEVWKETSNGARFNVYDTTYNGYTRDKMITWYDGYSNNGGTKSYSSTTWKDLSGSGNDGTVSGPVWYKDYLYFDGTNDYVTLPNLTNTFPSTYSFVYKTNSASNQIIFGYYNNKAGIGIYGNGLFITSLTTSSNVYDTGGITLDKFYKVDVVYRSLTDKTIYVNNKEIEKTSSTNYWSWGDSKSYLGRRSSGTYFKGGIKSFQVYSKALTVDEINHNYNYDKQTFNLE